MPRRKKLSMLNAALRGIIAGATGTVTLDTSTYLDMAIRGRSSSNAPSKMVDTVAKKIHLPLSTQSTSSKDQSAQNRESGLGALLGYVNGLGTGVIYGILDHGSMKYCATCRSPGWFDRDGCQRYSNGGTACEQSKNMGNLWLVS